MCNCPVVRVRMMGGPCDGHRVDAPACCDQLNVPILTGWGDEPPHAPTVQVARYVRAWDPKTALFVFACEGAWPIRRSATP